MLAFFLPKHPFGNSAPIFQGQMAKGYDAFARTTPPQIARWSQELLVFSPPLEVHPACEPVMNNTCHERHYTGDEKGVNRFLCALGKVETRSARLPTNRPRPKRGRPYPI